MLVAAWAERDAERAEKAQLAAECNVSGALPPSCES
jgi:hypothetical protein